MIQPQEQVQAYALQAMWIQAAITGLMIAVVVINGIGKIVTEIGEVKKR